MAQKPNPDRKDLALRQQGALHPHPEQVSDELFRIARAVEGSEELRQALAASLRRETGGAPFGLDSLVLFVQPAPGEPFAIRERHVLQGFSA